MFQRRIGGRGAPEAAVRLRCASLDAPCLLAAQQQLSRGSASTRQFWESSYLNDLSGSLMIEWE
jgi:hypothetical protein